MKLRHVTLVIAIALLLTLTACNFTLAADVTPPPGYVAPTPMPTLGPLFPASAPDSNNGEAIYIEKCLPCHGAGGLGDGEKGAQLPVTVAPIGLADTAQKAQPSAWYMQVTRGNVQRFMPPFVSLNDQERWDVVAYALMLHMTPDQIEKGKSLFESKCADCAGKFNNPEKMYSLSELDLINIIKNGDADIPAFGKDLTDEEAAAVAMYIRTLTFAAPAAEPTATAAPAATSTPAEATAEAGTPASEVTASPEAGTPAADVTPSEGTPADSTTEVAATPTGPVGNVSGKIDNKTGKALPADTKVILHGYEHGGDQSSGATEVFTQDVVIGTDGSYLFESIPLPEKRIYIADINVGGISYQSEFTVVKADEKNLELPPITMYANTEDYSILKMDALQIFFDFSKQGETQIFSLYSITNDSGKTVTLKLEQGQDIPFVAYPKNVTKLGYEASQDSAPFMSLENGFAMPPNKSQYGMVVISSARGMTNITISQPIVLPVEKVTVYLPESMSIDSKTLADEGIQTIQEKKYHVYTSGRVEKGTSIDFTLTGEPDAAAPDAGGTSQANLLIGVGAFGFVLILLGVWLFMRDRNKDSEEEQDETDEEPAAEFEDAQSVMDALIALDDLHRAGKISDEAHQKRREELKEALKRKS